MSLKVCTKVALTVGLAISAFAATSGAAVAVGGHASSSCHLSSHDQRGGLGPSYVTYLGVSGTSCNTGIAVVKGYYRCRLRGGGVKGMCHGSVFGFSCREQRTGIAIQFDAKVTCTRGGQRVYHTYTQNT